MIHALVEVIRGGLLHKQIVEILLHESPVGRLRIEFARVNLSGASWKVENSEAEEALLLAFGCAFVRAARGHDHVYPVAPLPLTDGIDPQAARRCAGLLRPASGIIRIAIDNAGDIDSLPAIVEESL